MRFLTILFSMVVSNIALAHGLPAGAGTVRLAGDTAYIVMTPDAGLFQKADADANGTLERSELSAHRKQIIRRFLSGFRLVDHKGRAGKVIFQDAGLPHHEGAERAHVRITLRYRWAQTPTQLRVRYLHANEAPLQIRTQRFTAAKHLTKQKPLGAVRQHNLVPDRSIELF